MLKKNTNLKLYENGLFFLSLGGIGEIGANCYLYCCDGKWIMIDLGLSFADEQFPGVDLLVPKIKFIEEIKDNLDNKSLLVAKGNCGIPQYQSGKISYSGTKSIMIKYAILCDLLGVDIIGGCCGTTPEHIKAIKNSFVKKNEYFKKYNFYKNHLLDEDYFRELTIKEIGRPWKNISDVEKPLNNQFRKRRRGSKFKNNL